MLAFSQLSALVASEPDMHPLSVPMLLCKTRSLIFQSTWLVTCHLAFTTSREVGKWPRHRDLVFFKTKYSPETSC